MVFMAEQQHPIRRRVALKVLKAGMDTRQVVARFEAERQALALMEHVGIARVLDGGETPSGRPYFVMELVKGISITRFCDEHQLTPRERLALFAQVCQAVQHAHQKGIIHRDLKPTNVLVAAYDGKPVPKVIDFGVAKALGQQLTERTLVTGFGSIVGTLEYMSPEQAEFNAMDVDTRADIYSLGVLLYELLTGTTPLSSERLKQAAMTEVLRLIREEEPPKPSTRLSDSRDTLASISAQRRLEPASLTKEVRGELDWIVMKALEKDRNRRYETANGLARDIDRYLNDEPVEASSPGTGYRLRKFVRRNRGPVLAASLLLVALAGGVVGTTVGLVRAEQARRAAGRRAEGERVAKELAEKRLAQIEKAIGILGSMFENLDPMAEEQEGRPLRAILGERLDQAAAELQGEAVGDRLVVAQLQDRLGQTYLGLGHAAKAEALFEQGRQDPPGPPGRRPPPHARQQAQPGPGVRRYRKRGSGHLPLPASTGRPDDGPWSRPPRHAQHRQRTSQGLQPRWEAEHGDPAPGAGAGRSHQTARGRPRPDAYDPAGPGRGVPLGRKTDRGHCPGREGMGRPGQETRG